jgi:hypothetical protein
MKTLCTITASAALLAACGGSGGGAVLPTGGPANAPGSDVPLAATQNPDAAFDFVASVAAMSSDSSEPLAVGDATLATTDTDDPKPL